MPKLKAPRQCRYNTRKVNAGEEVEVRESDIEQLKAKGWTATHAEVTEFKPDATADIEIDNSEDEE